MGKMADGNYIAFSGISLLLSDLRSRTGQIVTRYACIYTQLLKSRSVFTAIEEFS